jgi:hypothetical protein
MTEDEKNCVWAKRAEWDVRAYRVNAAWWEKRRPGVARAIVAECKRRFGVDPVEG